MMMLLFLPAILNGIIGWGIWSYFYWQSGDEQAATGTFQTVISWYLPLLLILLFPLYWKRISGTATEKRQLFLPSKNGWLMDTFIALIASGCFVALVMVGFKYNFPNSHSFTQLSEFQKVLHFLGMVIVAPVTEEVIFRGYGRQLANQREWSLMKASALTGLAFALWHGNPILMVQALVFGVVAYVLYEKFNTLFVPVISNFDMFFRFLMDNGKLKRLN